MDDTVLTVALVGAAMAILLLPSLRARMSGVRSVAPAEVQARLAGGGDLLVLDVRSEAEFAGGHIAGAVHVPLAEVAGRAATMGGELAAHRDTSVVVVCRSGPRAVSAATLLKRRGLRNVAVLRGGMGAWAAASLPVQGGA